MSYKADQEKKLKRLLREGEITREEYDEEVQVLRHKQHQPNSLRAKQIDDFNHENADRRYYDE